MVEIVLNVLVFDIFIVSNFVMNGFLYECKLSIFFRMGIWIIGLIGVLF